MGKPDIAERRELDWQAMLDTALTMPGNTGDTYRRLYDYSTANILHVMLQGVEPQPIATFKRWQALGRHVIKGAKAREIIRPVTMQRKNDEGEVEATFTKFRAVRCIFPYSDTAGDELPPVEHRDWDVDRAMGALDIEKVPYKFFENNTQGLSWGRTVAVNPVAKYPLKTLTHEISHVLAGHTSPEQDQDKSMHRGVDEFVAEGSAYLVLNELDLLDAEQASVSRGYCQFWLASRRPSEVSIRTIFKTTDAILHAGRLAIEAEPEIMEVH